MNGRAWPCTDELPDALVSRPIGAAIARAVRRTRVTPNGLTLLSALAGAAAGCALARGSSPALVAAAGLVVLSVALDCADGDLARMRGGGTPAGRVVDGLGDYAAALAIHAGLYAFLRRTLALPAAPAAALVLPALLTLGARSAFLDACKEALRGRGPGPLPAWAERASRGYERLRRACAGRPAAPSPAFLRLVGLAGPSTTLYVLAAASALAARDPRAIGLYFIWALGAANALALVLRLLAPRAPD